MGQPGHARLKPHSRLLWALWACLILIPAVGHLAFAAASSKVIVTLEPGKLVLGQSQRITIRAHMEDAEGTLIKEADIRLRTNVGTIIGIERSKPGEVKALYQPPGALYPQLAIIMAVARVKSKTTHGWTVLPLWGRGKARVYARRRAPVKVTIGKTVFGPVRTNRQGIANIPVVVPPGIYKARAGNRTIDLHIPPIKRISVISEHVRITAGDRPQTSLRIYVVTPLGEPASDALVRLKATRGLVTRPKMLSPGVFAAEYTPPNKVESGKDLVSVFLEGEKNFRDELELEIVPGTPARLEIEANPVVYHAGRGEKISVWVKVFDGFGNPVGAELILDTDLGSIGPARSDAKGGNIFELELPDAFGGKRQLRVQAATLEGIQAETVIALKAGELKHIHIEKPAGPILADGDTQVLLILKPLDDYNNIVPGLPVAASATEGTASEVKERSDGRYVVSYTPPLLRKSGHANLDASVGSVAARMRLELINKVYLVSITPRVGYMTNFVHLNAPFFTAELGLHLPFLGRNFFLQAECGYYFYNKKDDSRGIQSSLGVIPLIGSFAYRLELSDRFDLQMTIGGGVLFVSSNISIGDMQREKSHAVIGGAQADMGIGVRIGPGRARLRVGYIHATPGGAADITGNIGGLVFVGGYELGLF